MLLEELGYINKARGQSSFAKSLVITRIYSESINDSTIAQSIDDYLPSLYSDNDETVESLK